MKQEFSGAVENVAGRDINIYPEKEVVDIDPSVSRNCTQCKHQTWRYTRFCVHCNFDQFAYDAAIEEENRRALKFKVALVIGILGFAILLTGTKFQGKLSLLALVIGGVCIFSAINLLNDEN